MTTLFVDDWKKDIFLKLKHRNLIQSDPFVKLVNQNNHLLSRLLLLNEELKQTKAKHSSGGIPEIPSSPSSPTPSPSPSPSPSLPSTSTTGANDLSVEDLKSKLLVAQEQLNKSLLEIISLKNETKKAQENQKAAERKAEEWKMQVGILTSLNEKQKMVINHLEVANQVLGKELVSVKAEMTAALEKVRVLSFENDKLIQHVLKLKEEQVSKMNEINEMYQSTLAQQQKAMLQQKADENTKVLLTMDKNDLTMLGYNVVVPKQIKRSYEGHKDEITTINFSSMGFSFATGGADKYIRIWDASTGVQTNTLVGSIQSVMSVAFSPSGDFLLGASNDNTARVWSLQQGQNNRMDHILTGHVGKVFTGCFTSDSMKAVTGSGDRTIKIWDLDKGYCIRTIWCISSCQDLVITSDSSLICSGHADGNIRFWDPKTGDNVGEVSAHARPVTCTQLCPSNSMDYTTSNVLTLSRDNHIKIIDIRSHDILKTLRDERFTVPCNWSKGTWSPDGKYVAAPSADGGIYIWSTPTGKLEKILYNTNTSSASSYGSGGGGDHSKVVPLSCVAWNPNGSQVVSVDKAGCITLWEGK